MAHYQRYLILAVSFFAAVSVRAQQSGAAGEEAPRSVSIVALVNPGADYSGLFLMSGGQPISLDVKPGMRGAKQVLAKGSRDVVLARQGVDPATGKPAYLPVVSSPWPEAKSQEAILVIGTSAGAKEIKALMIDDSLAAFPIETTRVLNLTGAGLLAKVDTFQGELKHASASGPIPYPDLKKLPPNSLARFPFALAVKPANGDWIKIGSGFWEAATGRRSLVILQPPLEQGSTKIRIRTLVDYPAPPVPVPASR